MVEFRISALPLLMTCFTNVGGFGYNYVRTSQNFNREIFWNSQCQRAMLGTNHAKRIKKLGNRQFYHNPGPKMGEASSFPSSKYFSFSRRAFVNSFTASSASFFGACSMPTFAEEIKEQDGKVIIPISGIKVPSDVPSTWIW